VGFSIRNFQSIVYGCAGYTGDVYFDNERWERGWELAKSYPELTDLFTELPT